VRRREFVTALGGLLLPRALGAVPSRGCAVGRLLIPMDDRQTNHLKAYGVTYRSLERGSSAEWLLNYRGGSFLLDDESGTRREAALDGVLIETVSDAQVVDVRGAISAGNMDAVPLEKAPKVAVYAPPDAAPWDDAVTMVLEYAGISYDRVWDPEVAAGRLADYEWLHLHHEDFTGQYSKFFLTYSGTQWLSQMVQRNSQLARTLGYATVAELKKAVAETIRRYVDGGGFLFAMCTATETLAARPWIPRRRSGSSGSGASRSRARGWSCRRRWLPSRTSTGIRSTTRRDANRSVRSRCSTSAPRSIPYPPCWCSATATWSPTSTGSPRRSPASASSPESPYWRTSRAPPG
jgi:hypothetical protein